jgi:non-ribosomal peptide synthetase component E (peptide arylation enzyme)
MTDVIIPEQNRERIKLYRDQGLILEDTLSKWLEHNSLEYPGNPAIITSSASLSYQELSENVFSLAAGLQSLGLGKGDVIAVQLPNIPEYIINLRSV